MLTSFGFAAFGIGLVLSCSDTLGSDYDQMFWPQVVRGCSVMFCILPPTRLALTLIAKVQIPDASGLFNMMRNLGGAIGIAVIDTIIYSRAPEHSKRIAERIAAGDTEFANTIGIPQSAFTDPGMMSEFVTKAAFVEAINDAWAATAVVVLAALACVPIARATSKLVEVVSIKNGRVIVKRVRIPIAG